ncbi:MAG: hypothetical protein J1E85_04480 [Ruminococcus sp.]|nr:hypothetical protein [Ruminococcus sp.]
MKKTNINYPHPVLSESNEDYIDSFFDITLPKNPMIEGDLAKIEVSYLLESNGLKSFVSNEQAKVTIYLESVEAEYRKVFYFPKNADTMTIEINKNDLNKRLQVKGYIVAAERISPFKLSEHNSELFGKVPFVLRKGDILAIAEGFSVPLESYDPLVDRPSIFSIRKQLDNPKEEVSVDMLSRDKITILLNEDTFAKYQKLYEAPEVRSILASMFAVPVLVDALSYIKNADSEILDGLKGLKWYQVVEAKICELCLDLSNEDSMTKIANVILPHVFKTNIESFTDLFKNSLPSGGGE